MRHLAALGVVVLALGACRRASSQAGRPQQVLEDFAISQSVKGRPDWELRTRLAVLDEKAKVASLTMPEMDFYKDGKIASRLSALAGTAATESRDIRLSSSVVVTSLEDRSVLRTDQLDFSSAKNQFFTDKEVLVTRPGGSLRGRGLRASRDLSEITIFHQRTVIEETR